MRYEILPLKGIALSLLLVCSASNLATAATKPAVTPVAQSPDHPQTYRIPGGDRRSFNYDAHAEIQGYAQLVADSYATALSDAQYMGTAIGAFLASPSDDTLTHARDAWIHARRTWEMTEAFRFYDGPVDVGDNEPGPIERMDGWPIDPAAIDYVDGNPTAGIVNDMKLALTRATLTGRPGKGPVQPHPVATGWHAIEFLLWGQDPSGATGEPGDRPVTDYLAGQPNNDRRRAYLKLASDMLVEDLKYLVESWDPKSHNSYAAAFRLLNQREAVGRILNGVGQLTGQELSNNRLAAPLDAKDRRLLTSRFSATSYQDLIFALRGVRNVWSGDQGGTARPGIGVLVGRVDAPLGQKILHALNHAEESVALLRTPLERETLPAPAGSPAREDAERAIADLKQLANLLRDAGAKLGVTVYLPN